MTEQTGKQVRIVVHPINGFDFRIIPQGVAVTVRYLSAVASADGPKFGSNVESLTVGLTGVQARELASSLERAAAIIESSQDPSS
jgi:hypothetical protein